MTYDYRKSELTRVRDAGPNDDETWFRLLVIGSVECKHLNITPEELDGIIRLLSED